MSRLVVDASVLAKLFFPEDHSEKAERLLSGSKELLAPDLIWAEVANIVWKRHGRGEIDDAEAARVIREILRFPLLVTPCGALAERALGLAVETKRTVYDCLYLAMAVERRCPMITADVKLVNYLSGTAHARLIKWIGT